MVILDDFVSSPLDEVQEWTLIVAVVSTLSLFKEIHTVLRGTKAALESLVASKFEPI
jgi:hypothetical protein